jgi:hypothetical protein
MSDSGSDFEAELRKSSAASKKRGRVESDSDDDVSLSEEGSDLEAARGRGAAARWVTARAPDLRARRRRAAPRRACRACSPSRASDPAPPDHAA